MRFVLRREFDLQAFGIRPWLIRILHNLQRKSQPAEQTPARGARGPTSRGGGRVRAPELIPTSSWEGIKTSHIETGV